MKFTKHADLFLNVIIPLLSGILMYYISSIHTIPVVLNNYLADGLWAYAFISSILIIWDRDINILWISIAYLMTICYELFQYNHIISGTGDVYDIIIYFLFFFIAL